jgi:hypothetical protein
MNKPMTQQEFDDIAARAAAATPAPWKEGNNGAHQPRFAWINGPDWGKQVYGTDLADFAQAVNDGEFMARAREDVPALLAEVARLWKLQEPSQPDRHWSDDPRHSAGE